MSTLLNPPIFFDPVKFWFVCVMYWNNNDNKNCYWGGDRNQSQSSQAAPTQKQQRMNDRFSSLMFNFQTTQQRFIALLLPWQTKQHTETVSVFDFAMFSLFFVLCLFAVFFFFLFLFFNSTFSLSWCEMNIKGLVLLVSLQHTTAAQWDVIRTCVTTWQTVINSNCINDCNFSTTPSSSSKGAIWKRRKKVCENQLPKAQLGTWLGSVKTM